MASTQALTRTPTALTGISAGHPYTLQFKTPFYCFVQITDSVPDEDGSGAFQTGPNSICTAQTEGAQSIFVWRQDGEEAGGIVLYTLAAI